MRKFFDLISTNWLYRILAYFFLCLIIILLITYLSFATTFLSNSSGEYYFVLSAIIDFLILLIPIFILEKFRKSSLRDYLGLNINKKFISYLVRCFFYVLIPFAFVFITMKILNLLEDNTEFSFSIISLLQILVLFVLATQEEIVFRGFLMKTFNQKFSVFGSLIISSLLFSGIHSINHNYGIIASVNTFIAGLILGIMYFRSGNLWLPIFYHFFWNLFQTLILGSNISGNFNTLRLFNVSIDSELYQHLFGNEYGFESSIACFMILTITLIIVKRFETLIPENSSYSFRIHESSDRILLNQKKINDQ